MILIDANVLLYAKIADYPQHDRARAWLDQRLNAMIRVGLPWPSLLAFVRIATNARLFTNPMSIDAALDQVLEWLALPNVWIPTPTERHAEVIASALRQARATADLVPDAHLAALAIEHGLQLCSTDGDFRRFEGLRWEDPLAEPVAG